MSTGPDRPSLLRRVSGAMFWNVAMLPVVSLVNLAAAVAIRRGFGLESGIYDVALGMMNTILAHAGLGIPIAVSQFVPGLERSGGRAAVAGFLRRVAGLRFGLLALALVPVNVFAREIADGLHLGPQGVLLLRLVSVLVLLRAGADLAIKALQALLSHLGANLVQLAQALALVAAAAWALSAGGGIATLLGALAAGSALVAAGSLWLVREHVRRIAPSHAAPPGASHERAVPWPRLWRFALFMYVFEASNYFAAPSFASPALAAVSGGPAAVALFNVAFQFPMTVVVVILAGFQGLYRPLFASILAERSEDRIRTVFAEVSKVQAALLLPAGAGLTILLPVYIPLFFTDRFDGAVPLAQVLCVLLFFEALFNVGGILLSVDHRYGPVLATQALRMGGAPLFIWFAIRGDLLLATTAFGAGRVLAAALGFLVARHAYGVRFPAAFAARVAAATAVMAAVVATGRWMLPPTWGAAVLLTVLGVVLAALGTRWFRVLGPRELDLVARSRFPAHMTVARWLGGTVRPERP